MLPDAISVSSQLQFAKPSFSKVKSEFPNIARGRTGTWGYVYRCKSESD